MRWWLGRCTKSGDTRLKLSKSPSRTFILLLLLNMNYVDSHIATFPSEPERVFGELDIPADILEDLRANIARRLTPQPVKVRADLLLTNFAFSGILAIQAALAAGEALSTPEIPIKIRLVAPPLYVMISNTTDKQGAIDLLEKAVEVIGEVISKEEGGSLVVSMKPKAVSETDDLELAALMDRVARENKEVSGMSPPFLHITDLY